MLTFAKPHGLVDDPGATTLTVPNGRIAFEHVRFGYVGTRPIFPDLSLTIRPGEKIGVVTQDNSLLHRSIHDNIAYGRSVIDRWPSKTPPARRPPMSSSSASATKMDAQATNPGWESAASNYPVVSASASPSPACC